MSIFLYLHYYRVMNAIRTACLSARFICLALMDEFSSDLFYRFRIFQPLLKSMPVTTIIKSAYLAYTASTLRWSVK